MGIGSLLLDRTYPMSSKTATSLQPERIINHKKEIPIQIQEGHLKTPSSLPPQDYAYPLTLPMKLGARVDLVLPTLVNGLPTFFKATPFCLNSLKVSLQ